MLLCGTIFGHVASQVTEISHQDQNFKIIPRSTYAVYVLLFVLLFVSYFSLSEQLLIVVKNLGHVLKHYPVKKASFSLYSRTSSWLRRTSQMLHLRKTEQLRTRLARFRRLIVFNRNPLRENTAHLKFNRK